MSLSERRLLAYFVSPRLALLRVEKISTGFERELKGRLVTDEKFAGNAQPKKDRRHEVKVDVPKKSPKFPENNMTNRNGRLHVINDGKIPKFASIKAGTEMHSEHRGTEEIQKKRCKSRVNVNSDNVKARLHCISH